MSVLGYVVTIEERTLVSKRVFWRKVEEVETRAIITIESERKPTLRDLAAILEPESGKVGR